MHLQPHQDQPRKSESKWMNSNNGHDIYDLNLATTNIGLEFVKLQYYVKNKEIAASRFTVYQPYKTDVNKGKCKLTKFENLLFIS